MPDGFDAIKPVRSSFPAFVLGGMSQQQEAKLDDLTQQVADLTATCNQMKALLWQIAMKQQGITLNIQPNDVTDIQSIISAAGITLK